MIRKLLLCGILSLAGKGSTAQAFVAVALSFGFFAAQVQCCPCKLPSDNYLRAAVELQIFATSLVCLALKADQTNMTVGREFYDWTLVVLFAVNIPIAFCCCLFLKLRAVRTSLHPDAGETAESRAAKAFQLYSSGVSLMGDEEQGLIDLIAALKREHKEHLVHKQLQPADLRHVELAREDFGLAANMPISAVIAEAAVQLGLDLTSAG